MTFWLIVAGWLVACLLAIWWVTPRIEASQKELEHEEALEMDEEWNREGYPVGLPPAVFDLPRNKERGFQDRARRAEELGFRDEDSGPWVA